jgi:hypothetical protein
MARASDLARGLGAHAEAVCRHYLPSGGRQGRYWICGDVIGTPGRSLYVRLSGPRAGKWTEYVARVVMLRIRDLALSHGRLPASTQHNVSTWRGIS